MEISGQDIPRYNLRRSPPPPLVDVIKELLIADRYAPGDRLPSEADLQEVLGASRSAVREAVRSLASLGIVEIRHGSGMYLAQETFARLGESFDFWQRLLTPEGDEFIRHLSQVRRALELGAIGDSVDLLTDEDLDALAACVEQIAAGADHGTIDPAVDRKFHETLYSRTENWLLRDLISVLWDCTEKVTDYEGPIVPPREAAEHHAAIYEALRRRDRDAARIAMEAHFPLERLYREPEQ